MAVKIDKKIKGYAVLKPEDKAKEAAQAASVQRDAVEAELKAADKPMADVIQMHERIERPAVLIGSTGQQARELAAGLAPAGLDNPRPRILRHALWAQDSSLGREPALQGALFSAPDPRSRATFDARFEGACGERRPRLAGVDPLRGSVQWEVAMASPRGTNEVERLADLVGPPLRIGDTVCARAFQSAVACADVSRGALLWSRNVGGIRAIGGDAERVVGRIGRVGVDLARFHELETGSGGQRLHIVLVDIAAGRFRVLRLRRGQAVLDHAQHAARLQRGIGVGEEFLGIATAHPVVDVAEGQHGIGRAV